MQKILNLSSNMEYGLIYRQRGEVKPRLKFMLLVDLELLSEF
jgi:hypothetical protein